MPPALRSLRTDLRRIPVQLIRPSSANQLDLLPNFCSGGNVLSLAFTMELVAIVLTLASGTSGHSAMNRLLLVSLYLQWIGLCSAAAMCLMRRFLDYPRPERVIALSWAILVCIVVIIADAAYRLSSFLRWDFILSGEQRVEFIVRHAIIAALVTLMLLRYFWVRSQWTMQVRAEGEARYQALVSRIQPHFLFNSLNSLAALIQVRPDDAEMMVVDLSDLFRASLDKGHQMAKLVDEIGLCHAYLRIEKLRLGDKLKVEWDIPEELLEWPVPRLVVQPLIENAVYHGISFLTEGGCLRIVARQIFDRLAIEVSNPLAPDSTVPNRGNNIAIDNIAQRLNLIYGDGASLEMGKDLRLEGGVFRARLNLPQNPRSKFASQN